MQFERWRQENGIPVDENGIAEWPFELRCKVINHCRFYGAWAALKFPIDAETIPKNSENNADSAPNNLPEGA